MSAILIVTHTGGHSVAVPGEESQGESSSRPLFDIYVKTARVEDETTAESWRAVASDALIFVSPNIVFHAALHSNSSAAVWIVLRS